MVMALCRKRGALIINSIPFSSSIFRSTSFSFYSSHISRCVRPVITVTEFTYRFPSTTVLSAATLSTHAATTTPSSLVNDIQSNGKYSHPEEETDWPPGCDLKHWLVIMEKPEGEPTRDEIIDTYIKTLSKVLGSVRPAISLTEFPKWFPSTTIIGAAAKLKCMSTEADTLITSSSLNDYPRSNLNSRTPRLIIDGIGMDFEHWIIVMEKPQGEPTRDEIIATYINTLSKLLGSEEEARMKIYSVSTRYQFAFGALISEDQRYKIRELPGVRWVFPDAYLDAANKDYGGEPFINGKAVPYDPKYDKKWGPWNFDERDMEQEKKDTQNPE